MSNDNAKNVLKSKQLFGRLNSSLTSIKKKFDSARNYFTGTSIKIPQNIRDKLPKVSESDSQGIYNSLFKQNEKFTNELKAKIHNTDFIGKLTAKDIENWDPIVFCVLNEESSATIVNILQKLHSANKSLTTEQKKILMPIVETILLEKGNQSGKFDENVKRLIENLGTDEIQYLSKDFLEKIAYIVIIKLTEQQINSFSQKQLAILLNRQDISSCVIEKIAIDKFQNSSCEIDFYGLCEKMGSKKVLKMKSSELKKLKPKNLKSLLKFIYESSNPKGNNKFSDDQLGVQKDTIKTFISNPKLHSINDNDLDYLVAYLNEDDIQQMFPVKNLQDNIEQYETVITKFTSEQIHYFSKEQVETLLEKQKLSDSILKNLSQQQLKNLSSGTIANLIQENKLPGNLKLDNSTIKSLLSQLGLLPIEQKYGNEYGLNQNQKLDLTQEKIQAAKKLLNAVTGEQKNENWDQYKLTIDALEMLSKIKNNNIKGVTSAFELLDKNKNDSIRLQLFANALAKDITPEIAKNLTKDQISKLIELEKINDIPFGSINNLNKDEIQTLSQQAVEKIIELHKKNRYSSCLNQLIPKFNKNQISILLKENIGHKFLNQDRLQKIDPQILFDKDIIKLIPAHDITSLISTTNKNTNNSNKENNLEHFIQNNPEIFTQDQINVLIASDNIRYFKPEFLIKLESEQIKKFDTKSLTEQQLNKLLSSEKFQYLNQNVITNNNIIDSYLSVTNFQLSKLSEEQKKCLITSGKFLCLHPDNYKKLTQDKNYQTTAQDYISNMKLQQAQKIFPQDTLRTLIDILAPNNQIRYLQNAIFEQLNYNRVRQINEYMNEKNSGDIDNKESEFLTDNQFDTLFQKNLIINLNPDYVVSKLTEDQIKQISYVYINTSSSLSTNLIFTNGEKYLTHSITIDQLISLSETEKFKHINPGLLKLAPTFDLNKMTYNATKEKLKQLNLKYATAEQILVLFSNQDFLPTEKQQAQAIKKFNDINFENMSQNEIDFYISKDFFKPTETQIEQLQNNIKKKIASMNDSKNSEPEVTDEDRFISKVLDKIGSQKAQEMLANINFSTLSIKRINFYISRESFTPTKQQIDQLITKINHVNSSQKEQDIQSSDKNDFVNTVLKKIAPYITQDRFKKINFQNLGSNKINDLFEYLNHHSQNITFTSNQISPLINIMNRYQSDNIRGIGRLSCDVLKKVSNQITLEQLKTINLNNLSTGELDALFSNCESISKKQNSKETGDFFSSIESKNDDKLINKLSLSDNFVQFYLNFQSPRPHNNMDSIMLMENKPDFTKTKLFLRIFQKHLANNTQETDGETQQSEAQNEAYTKFINDLDDEAFQKFDFSTSENDIIKCLSVEKLLTLPDGISVSDQYLDKLRNAKIEIQKWASNLNFIFGIGGFVYMFFKSETLNKIDDKIQSWQNQKNQNINCGNQQQSQTTRNAVIPQHENKQSKNQNQQQAETKNSSSIFGKIKKAWHRAWENHEEQK